MAVLLTDTAAREIASIVKSEKLDAEQIRLRVGVRGGGCSGFSYLLDLTETQKQDDEEWEYTFELANAGGEAGAEANGDAQANGDTEANGHANGDGSFTLKVICDPKSYLYLNGTTVDFKDELMGRGFVFNNPNATNTCGCGSSFAM